MFSRRAKDFTTPMASVQQSAFFLLFLALFRVTISSPRFIPINSSYYDEAQFLSRFAVDQNNNEGKSHLIFIDYVNGTHVYAPYVESRRHRLWVLRLNAKNCSEPSTPASLYVATIDENDPAESGQIHAYGSNFTYLSIDKL